MIKEPKISIIVPVYNGELFLDRCIKSILEQDYQNIELILVDDCSKDNSKTICEKYKSIDKRVKYYRNDINKGQASTRNIGISYSTGDYITFVDNDDTIPKDMYMRLITLANETNLNIVGCGTNMVYEDHSVDKFEGMKSGIVDSYDVIYNILYQTRFEWGTVWNKLFSKRIKKDLIFLENKEYEDYYLMIKLCLNNRKIYFDNSIKYNWYQRSTSQSKRGYHKGLNSFDDICEEIKKIFKKVENNIELMDGLKYFEFVIRAKMVYLMWKNKNIKKKEILNQINKVKKLKKDVFKIKNCYVSRKKYIYYSANLIIEKLLLFRKRGD